MRGCSRARICPGPRCNHGHPVPSHRLHFPLCSRPDKPLRIRIAWLPGSNCADLPVLHLSPSVVLVVQTGGLADQAVNPGQDAAQSLSLYLGKMEAEVYPGFALIRIWHIGRLCTGGHKNGHTLGAYTVTNTDFFFFFLLSRPPCANVRKSAGINLFNYICLTSPAAEEI